MAHSTSEAVAATETLLQKIKPHSKDVMALMVLEDFLPVAKETLNTIGTFKAEVPTALETYILICQNLTKAIKESEETGKVIAWRDVTVDGKSWHYYREELQECIRVLQANAVKKKAETPLPPYTKQQPTNEELLPPYNV